ncbi:translocation and assembly module lipoprotein TamL [Robertkochia aurantiaca]|uniref:translocation and assembly module lipoprotein TamL n=1 Tax=Robertkochia aurantiaca TaxID=2873700 RepID=UPI001CC9CF6C|nr:BamA/TamA family outer membrane protein [Robertkochia sp. 3YJGBD-33]
MKNWFVKITVFSIILLISSCNAVKRVPEGELLLRENTILLNGEKVSGPEINGLITQQPNTLTRLYIYNQAKPNADSIYNARLEKQLEELNFFERMISAKQLIQIARYKKGFHSWLRSTGEPPVLIREEKTQRSLSRLKQYYDTKGYFNNTVSHSIDTADYKPKRAGMTYRVNTGRPYIIDTLTHEISSPELDSLYEIHKKRSLINQGERFELTNFSNERQRLNNIFVNSGIYKFQPSDITFDIVADTSAASDDYFMPVTLNIKNKPDPRSDTLPGIPYKVHKIRNVNIYADYTFNADTTNLDSIHHEGYNIFFHDKLRYKPSALTDAMAINPGDVFKESARNLTSRQIGNLKTFKYPNITYRYADSTAAILNTNIYLTPRPRFSLGLNTDISHSNIQDIGISLSTSLVSRNIFRGAETLEFAFRGTIGSSSEINNVTGNFFNIAEFGGDVRLNFPRIVSPFNTSELIPKYMSPETRWSLGTTFQQNIGLDKQSVNAIWRYNWRPTDFRRNIFDLFNIQYVRNLNTERYYFIYRNSYEDLNTVATENSNQVNPDYFNEDGNLTIPQGTAGFTQDALNGDIPLTQDEFLEVNRLEERRERLTANNLIFSASFTWNKNNREGFQDNDFYQFQTKIESAGNTFSALDALIDFNKTPDGKNTLFGVQYSQYIKTEFDYVKYWQLSRSTVLAFHSFFGIAIPYGNADNIPFLRSYFAGGSNDNRAWEAYSLGPGSTDNLNDFNEANMKLALNLEYRFPIFGQLKSAIFADAGNIWNVWDDVTLEKAVFEDLSSLEEIALGTGIGLRYDFNFFVIRFDVGFKTYNPANEPGSRWFKEYNLSNAVFNIGINYPF